MSILNLEKFSEFRASGQKEEDVETERVSAISKFISRL